MDVFSSLNLVTAQEIRKKKSIDILGKMEINLSYAN